MKIQKIDFKNGIYSITVLDNEVEKVITGKLRANGFDGEILDRFNILSNDIKEVFSINSDEYIIAIPRMMECMPDDTIIPLGLLRLYITNHMDEESIFSLELLEDDLEIDATDLQFQLICYFD